jgi:hypothetical protein
MLGHGRSRKKERCKKEELDEQPKKEKKNAHSLGQKKYIERNPRKEKNNDSQRRNSKEPNERGLKYTEHKTFGRHHLGVSRTIVNVCSSRLWSGHKGEVIVNSVSGSHTPVFSLDSASAP